MMCAWFLSCGSRERATGVSKNVAPAQRQMTVRDYQRLEERDRHNIGEGYACTVFAEDGHLIIFVTDDDARVAAEEVLRQLESQESVEVRMTSPRLKRSVMDGILADLRRGRPAVPGTFGYESPIGRSTCPRVELGFPVQGKDAAAGRRWAKSAIARYGDDRVTIAARAPRLN